MALAIRDTAPIRGAQAEALREMLFREAPKTGKLVPKRLDARLSQAAIDLIRRLPSTGK